MPERTGQRTEQTALVTGASAGLGREFARLFAADGHDLVLVARRRARLEELAAELEAAHGVKSRVISADLTDPAAPRAIAEQLADTDVEFLVNNAGFGSNGPFVDQELDRELEMVAVNCTALLALTHLFLPPMLERGHGRVLNIGSSAGFQPGPYMATYYASKAFVNSFSEALAHEVAGTGVTVTVSCPGPVATEFGEVSGNGKSRLFKSGVASSDTIARQAYAGMMKGKRMVVHGFAAKAGLQVLRVSPRATVQRIAARLNKPA